jgi:tRNA threonylcarbamoyladenosine biosynthesis protein TsaE
MKKEFFLHSEAEMNAFSAEVASGLKSGDIIFLEGNLGAGKTTFTRGLLRALGFEGRVKSPTFTLVEPYDLTDSHGFFLYHYDLYRINIDSPEGENAEVLENLGLRDQINQQDILVIEWPDRLKNMISPSINIQIEFWTFPEGESGRKISWTGPNKGL